MPKMKRSHIVVLAAMCSSIAASVGLISSIGGLFITPIAERFGVGRGGSSMNMTILSLACGVGGTLMPRIMKKKNYKLLTWIFVAATVASTLLLAFAPSIALMYVLNAIRGFTTGFLGIVAATVILNNWFHKNTALFTSIAMAFSGVAGAIFTPIFSSIVTNKGYVTGYIVSAIIMLVLYLPVMVLKVGLDPGDVGELAFGEVEGVKRVQFTRDDLPKTNTKIPVWLYIVACVFAAMSGFLPAINSHYTGISVAYGFSVSVGATMISIAMIINTSGKLLLGFLIDKIGLKKSMLSYFAAILAGCILILTVKAPFTFYISAALIGFCQCTCTVGLAMTCREAFGVVHYAQTYPKISLVQTIIYAFANTIDGLIYDITGSYTLIFWIMLVFTVAMMFCMFVITGAKHARKEK